MFNFVYPTLDSFGLDISDHSVKLVMIQGIGKRGEAGRLVSYNTFPFEAGLMEGGRVINKEKLASAIREGITKARGQTIKTNAAVIALPEEQCFVRVVQLPPMPEAELFEAVSSETEGNIPLSMDEVYFDWQIITRPDTGTGKGDEHVKHFDVLVAATPKEVVDEYEELLKTAGLLPVVFEPESFAIARAALRSRISYSPLLLVDLGETHTTLTIVSGTTIRVTASVVTAAGSFTELIASAFKVTHTEAEQKKREHGISQEGEGYKIFKVLEAPLSDLIEQIRGYLSFYASHSFHEHQVWTLAVKTPDKTMGTFDFRPVSRGEILVGRDIDPSVALSSHVGAAGISRIFLSGGGANLAGLPEYLSAALKVSVQRADPLVNITAGVAAGHATAPFDPLSYTTAIGLGMRKSKTVL